MPRIHFASVQTSSLHSYGAESATSCGLIRDKRFVWNFCGSCDSSGFCFHLLCCFQTVTKEADQRVDEVLLLEWPCFVHAGSSNILVQSDAHCAAQLVRQLLNHRQDC